MVEKKVMNRRGAEMSVNTIVLIVIGVLVLLFLIIGFSVGWSRIGDLLIRDNNIGDLTQHCTTACSSSSLYDYCTQKKDLKVEDETVEDITCAWLAVERSTLGFNACGAIDCTEANFFAGADNNTIVESCKGKTEGVILRYPVADGIATHNCTQAEVSAP